MKPGQLDPVPLSTAEFFNRQESSVWGVPLLAELAVINETEDPRTNSLQASEAREFLQDWKCTVQREGHMETGVLLLRWLRDLRKNRELHRPFSIRLAERRWTVPP